MIDKNLTSCQQGTVFLVLKTKKQLYPLQCTTAPEQASHNLCVCVCVIDPRVAACLPLRPPTTPTSPQ